MGLAGTGSLGLRRSSVPMTCPKALDEVAKARGSSALYKIFSGSVFSCESVGQKAMSFALFLRSGEAMDLERGGDNFLFIEGTMPCKVNRLFAVLKEGAR